MQAQLGHASISLTADLYGRWLPTGNRALIDQLDGEEHEQAALEARQATGTRGDQSVTISANLEIPSPQVIGSIGATAPDLSLSGITRH